MRLWGWANTLLLFTLITIGIAMPIGSLHAQSVFSSNSLGQELGAWEGERWRLVREEELTTLYDEELIVWYQREDKQQNSTTIERWTVDQPFPDIQVFVDGRLHQRKNAENIKWYHYDQAGRLEMITTRVDDRVTTVELITYQGPSSALLSILSLGEKESVRTFDESDGQRLYLYQGPTLSEHYRTLQSGVEIIERLDEEASRPAALLIHQEGGAYHIIEDQVEKHYNPQGLLIEIHSPTSTSKLGYNERDELIIHEQIGEDGLTTTTFYEEGGTSMRIERFDGVLVKRILYNEDGSRTETLYDEGAPYSDIVYAPSSNRVRSITYY